MKNSKMFLIMVITTSFVCMAAGKKEIEELGYLLHYGSMCCRERMIAPQYCQQLNNIEPLAAQLTYSQFLEACNLKIDRKSAIAVASSQKCDACDRWAIMLKDSQDIAEFVVNELKVGHLTRKEILENPELAEKLHDFESEQYKNKEK